MTVIASNLITSRTPRRLTPSAAAIGPNVRGKHRPNLRARPKRSLNVLVAVVRKATEPRTKVAVPLVEKAQANGHHLVDLAIRCAAAAPAAASRCCVLRRG